jgi:hypothetical protein
MMVFWQERLAFLATPKTASTAIESALGALAAVVIQRPKVLKHTDAARFAAHWQPYLTQSAGDRFEVAALMREPRDWLGSWYRDGQREDVEPAKSTRSMSFDDFVRAYCAPGPRPAFADVGSQVGFLGRPGETRVDHLFRYDDLTGFAHFLEDRLGCEIHLPRLNVSPKGEITLTAETDALLHQICAEDFALYAALGRR